ncbi:MAG: hypothetical protein E6R03_07200 [Hyphomicrobiaceae bacterium]|nr:MAG: hypothetical protein E6R03_07200 [Hyphomicrobiaceae bacterium]
MKQTSLAGIAKLTEGTVIDYVFGHITKIEPCISAKMTDGDPKEAKQFTCQRVHITAEDVTVMVKFWDRPEMQPQMAGNPIHIWAVAGKVCIKTKIESGRGGKKIYLNVTKDAEVSMNPPENLPEPEAKPVSEPAAAAKPTQGESFDSLPAVAPKAAATHQQASSGAAKASKTHPQPGVRVGMAMNLACANLTSRSLPLEPVAVMEITSDLLRIAEWFEAGNLMPTYTERKTADKSKQS